MYQTVENSEKSTRKVRHGECNARLPYLFLRRTVRVINHPLITIIVAAVTNLKVRERSSDS